MACLTLHEPPSRITAPRPWPTKIEMAAAHLANAGHVTARRIVVGALAAELARTWSEIDRHPNLARTVADLRRN